MAYDPIQKANFAYTTQNPREEDVSWMPAKTIRSYIQTCAHKRYGTGVL